MFTITIFVLLGVVTNVAVAWACALTFPLQFESSGNICQEDMNWLRAHHLPVDWDDKSSPIGWVSEFEPFVMDSASFGIFERVFVGPPWLNSRGGGVPPAVQTRAGWPCMSFYADQFTRDADNDLWEYRYSITRERFDTLGLYARIVFPVLPIWPGFAINTMFYGGVPWLLVCGPFEFRRYRRRKRGLCVHCAYPIGMSDVCTECGRAVARQ